MPPMRWICSSWFPILCATQLSELRRLFAWPKVLETLTLLAVVALAAGAAFGLNRVKLVWLIFHRRFWRRCGWDYRGQPCRLLLSSVIGTVLVLSGKTLKHWKCAVESAQRHRVLQLILGGQALTLLPVGSDLCKRCGTHSGATRKLTASLVTANRLESENV